MAAFLPLRLLILWVALQFCCRTVSAASVMASFTPSPAIKGSRQQHAVRCDFTIAPQESFYALSMKATGSKELARMNLDGTYLWFTGGSLNNRGYLQGSKDEGYLSMVLNDTLCTDNNKGYTCKLDYKPAGGNALQTKENATTIQVGVDAGQLSMSVSLERPVFRKVRKVGDKLSMRCLGAVGFVNTAGENPQPQITWVWQYRYSGGHWTTYKYYWDITVGSFISIPNKCYKNQSSILTRRLTLADSGREYRCFVRHGFQDKEKFAASYFIGSVISDGATFKNCPAGSLDVQRDADDVHLICQNYMGKVYWSFYTTNPDDQLVSMGIAYCNSTHCENDCGSSFPLSPLSATSSRLNITRAAMLHEQEDSYHFFCQRWSTRCAIRFKTAIKNCPTGSLVVERGKDFGLDCVNYVGTATWEFKTSTSTRVTIGKCNSTGCQYDFKGLSSLFTLTTQSNSSNRLTVRKIITSSRAIKSRTFFCNYNHQCRVYFGSGPHAKQARSTQSDVNSDKILLLSGLCAVITAHVFLHLHVSNDF